MKLPPLPMEFVHGGMAPAAHWMRDYGIACARAALEAAAGVCEDLHRQDKMSNYFKVAANAIRKLEIET